MTSKIQKDKINGDLIYLRMLNVSDVTEKYVHWLNDPNINKFLEVRHQISTKQSCIDFITSMNQDIDNYLFGIFDKSNAHIGNAKLGFINNYYHRGQISLFIGDTSFWGKGAGLEAVNLLTTFGFEALKLQRIEAGCYESNLASLKTFLKAGYTIEGIMRNHVISAGEYEGCYWLGKLAHEHT